MRGGRSSKPLAAIYPEGVFTDPSTWPRARRLDALAPALVDSDTDSAKARKSLDERSAGRLGAYKHGALAAYAQARPLYERALAIREKALGPEHTITANSLNGLGLLLWDQGDFAGARPLYERALAIREKALGPEHPDTATSLNNLAYLLEGPG